MEFSRLESLKLSIDAVFYILPKAKVLKPLLIGRRCTKTKRVASAFCQLHQVLRDLSLASQVIIRVPADEGTQSH